MGNTTYGDAVPDEPIDLLWSNRMPSWQPNVRRMIYFASVAHVLFVERTVTAAATARGLSPIESSSFASRLHAWQTYERAARIAVIGNAAVSETFTATQPTIKQRLTLLDCGVDTVHFHPLTDHHPAPTFVHAATRFSIRKGSHIVADAWRTFVARNPKCRLVLLGRDGDVDMKKALNGIPGVSAEGAFEAGAERYLKQLSQAHWVILPSLAEGQAGTLLEAMSCGCIPIASLMSGINAERYGGIALSTLSPLALTSAMEHALANYAPSAHSATRQHVINRHNWSTFESSIHELSLQTLHEPPFSPPGRWAILSSFLSNVLREVLPHTPRQ